MTEAEWETCTDAAAMLAAVRQKRGERKFRLLACACARSLWSGLVEGEFRQAVEAAEFHADDGSERLALRRANDNLSDLYWGTVAGDPIANAAAAASTADFAGHAAEGAVKALGENAADVIREIIGNPYRDQGVPVGADHDAVRILSQHCYSTQYFDHLPQLAEMLVECGCDDQRLLAHLRLPGPHYRGCWALDAVLGYGSGKELVTTTEWQQTIRPFEMLHWWEFYRGKPSARKRRLLACASCRLVDHLLIDESLRHTLAMAEAYADGLIAIDELTPLHEQARSLGLARGEMLQRTPMGSLEWSTIVDSWRIAHAVAETAGPDDGPFGNAMHHTARDGGRGIDTEDAEQAALIRDVLGSPFGEPVIAATWWTADVLALARGIYDERAFDRLPILEDALQDAGCEDEAILEHCHSKGPHVRGCWVVDLLLGKS